MIVYSATRAEFTDDVKNNQISVRIRDVYLQKIGKSPPFGEILSWANSMQFMNNVLERGEIPADAHVAIEYRVPLTSKRVDFILTGQDDHDRNNVLIVELKQWSEVKATDKDGIVESYVGGGIRELTHPSYQAWTYAALIEDFNVEVQEGDIELYPCAYLHNCADASVVKSDFYERYLKKAPVYIQGDEQKLAEFLSRYVRKGDRDKTMYRIEHGKIRPSKQLADHLQSLLSGNTEFQMIDDQKVVYETVLNIANEESSDRKHVIIVEGGPGTGKSVVAINLLVALTNQVERKNVLYVSKNAAPRTVWASKLTGTNLKGHIDNLFKSSGIFVDTDENAFNCLIVDEAHRVNEKSGFYQNQGFNQIAEIINAAELSVFFLDEDQRVTLKDIGSRKELLKHAHEADAEIHELKLESQFRCNGSDGYLAWLDDVLAIRETANESISEIDFDFQVFDSPRDLHEEIKEKNEVNNKSRMVAGYCWEWKGKKDPSIHDVRIPEFGYEARWNLDKDGSLWIVEEDSVAEVGCIHTCQGLELDYVGVIVGADFVVRDGRVVTDGHARATQDRSVFGWKKMAKADSQGTYELVDRIIKNTYRTLMSRGQKGCYVFCVDEETNEYFKAQMGQQTW